MQALLDQQEIRGGDDEGVAQQPEGAIGRQPVGGGIVANEPCAGTVLVVVPAAAAVGVTVVPRSGSESALTSSDWWASSMVA